MKGALSRARQVKTGHALMPCGERTPVEDQAGPGQVEPPASAKCRVSRSLCQPDCNGISSVAMWVSYLVNVSLVKIKPRVSYLWLRD